MAADATFHVKSWNEEPCEELPGGAKVTRATVNQTYSGHIEGLGRIEYVMFHRSTGSAIFVGLETIQGSVGGKSGTFVIRHAGVYEGGSARSEWSVVPDSGTDELAAVRGSGSFEADHTMTGQVSLDLSFG